MDFEQVLRGFAAMFTATFVVVILTLVVLAIAGWWKVFTKAGQPGWAVIIPIYNFIVLLNIVGRPAWWVVLMFVPLVNIVISIIVHLELAKSFGKGTGFGLGLVFLGVIFFPILGFGDARYQGPVNPPPAAPPVPA